MTRKATTLASVVGCTALQLAFAAVLVATLSGCFSAPPQIISIEPNRGSTSVAANQPITVVFNRTLDQNSVRGRFHVSPALAHCDVDAAFGARADAPCRVEWLTDRPGFVFKHPGAVFAPSTKYGFSIDAGVRDTAGVVNVLDHHWDLTSQAAPTISATTPTNGSTGIAVDAPIAVEFDRPMDATNTAGAISLTPPVANLKVVRNTLYLNRLVLLPNQMLLPNRAYTLNVSTRAVDAFGQPLAQARHFDFTTGQLGNSRHLAVLVGPDGGPATEVLMMSTTPAQKGDPVRTVRVLDVSTEKVALGAVAVSPGGRYVAVVQQPLDASVPQKLRVIDVITGRDTFDVSGAGYPSWSHSGDLAYGQAGRIAIHHSDGSTILLPPGDPLVGGAVWNADSSLIVLPVAAAGQLPHVDLASPTLAARYPAPGIAGSATNPVLSPNGRLLALRRDSTADSRLDGTWVVSLGGSAAAPMLLDADATPVGFADDATLVVAKRPDAGDSHLARLTLGRGLVVLPGGPVPSDLASAAVSPDGRQIAYLAVGGGGSVQAWIENADGSAPALLTTLTRRAEAVGIAFST